MKNRNKKVSNNKFNSNDLVRQKKIVGDRPAMILQIQPRKVRGETTYSYVVSYLDTNAIAEWWENDIEKADKPKPTIYEPATPSKSEMAAVRIPNNYKGKTPQDVWRVWTRPQRVHFIFDHEALKEYRKNGNTVHNKKYSELPDDVKFQLKNHIETGQYAKGGKVRMYISPSEYRDKLEGMSDEKLAEEYSYETGISVEDSMDDIENERDSMISDLVDKYKQVMGSRGEKFEDGGVLDPQIARSIQLFNVDPNLLPSEARKYLYDEILADPDINLIDENDEVYLKIRNYFSGTAPTEPIETASEPPSKALLQTRLKIISAMIKKDPGNSLLKTRKKIIEKMLSSAKMAKGGTVGDDCHVCTLTQK